MAQLFYNLEKTYNMDGHVFEEYVSKMLNLIGINSKVTRGSGDQGVDIISKFGNDTYAIQTKCFKNLLSNTPIQEVLAGKIFYKCKSAVVITNSGYTNGAKELADSVDVELWDYVKLEIAFDIANMVIDSKIKRDGRYDNFEVDSLFTRVILESAYYDYDYYKEKGIKLFKTYNNDGRLIICSKLNKDNTVYSIDKKSEISSIHKYLNSLCENIDYDMVEFLKRKIYNGDRISSEVYQEAFKSFSYKYRNDYDDEDKDAYSNYTKAIAEELVSTVENILNDNTYNVYDVTYKETKYYIDIKVGNEFESITLIKAYKSGYGTKPFGFSIYGYNGEETKGQRNAINRSNIVEGLIEFSDEIVGAFYKISNKLKDDMERN